MTETDKAERAALLRALAHVPDFARILLEMVEPPKPIPKRRRVGHAITNGYAARRER